MDTNRLTQFENDWICRSIHPSATLHTAESLVGATTSDLFLCTVELPELIVKRVVLRRYAGRELSPSEVEMAEQEEWALTAAESTTLSTPRLIASDLSGSGGRNPMILMSCVPGRVVLLPENMDNWLREMAGALYVIHQVPAEAAPYHYLPWYDKLPREPPSWSRLRSEWAAAISIALGPPPDNPQHFIHRDFHPCNVLFEGDCLSGVVDWVNGCRGMAGVDIAHCRWNLALLHGMEAADTFVDLYKDFAGPHWEYEPYFDLVELSEKSWTPNVYSGWPAHGMVGLSDKMMLERTESMLLSALSRL